MDAFPGKGSGVRAEEAQVGKRVVVRRPLRRADCLGMGGTIAEVWGDNHRHVALDVLPEDGESCLYWQHELEAEIDAKDA